MVFRSDKFSKGRNVYNPSNKKQITFKKFIKIIDKKKTEVDLVAAFNFYNISCDYCLHNYSKVVNMYIIQTEDVKRLMANPDQDIYPEDLFVRCSNCYRIEKVRDLRKFTAAGTIVEPIIGNEADLYMRNQDEMRGRDHLDMLPDEVKPKYIELLNMTKINKEKQKELEKYTKDYANISKYFKGKPFEKDIEALNTSGMVITKIENVEI